MIADGVFGKGLMAHIWLRLVVESDAAFILSLRTDNDKNRFMTSIDNDLKAQTKWVSAYREREAAGREYYFIIECAELGSLGTVRVYDFVGNSFSWGSWMLKRGAPGYASIESALAVYEFSFGGLEFEYAHFEVRKGNGRVVEFHKRSGAMISAEDDMNIYFNYELEAYSKFKIRYSKFFKN